jgi:hypothetical protein
MTFCWQPCFSTQKHFYASSFGGVVSTDNKHEKETSANQKSTNGSLWEFPRHQLKIVSKIGEGCFGQVWKYEATEGVPGYNKVNVPMSKCSKKINLQILKFLWKTNF